MPSTASSDVPAAHRLTLGEGATAVQASRLDPRVLLKREDLNPTGSHKDRAASFQLARAAAAGSVGVTISSSGNAAIATSRYAALHGITACVCVHPTTEPAKLAAIGGSTTTVIVTPRAINTAKHIARELGYPNLRPSVHDDALIGYSTLGDELAMLDVDAVVLFATSGATAVAVADQLAARHPGAVAVHFVQGEGNAALADPDSQVSDQSARGAAAGRLGVRHSRRSRQLLAAIAGTGGSGHVVSAERVAEARLALLAEDIEVSDESAANYAVALELAATGARVACVISGAPPTAATVPPARMLHADDEHDALEQLLAAGLVAALPEAGR